MEIYQFFRVALIFLPNIPDSFNHVHGQFIRFREPHWVECWIVFLKRNQCRHIQGIDNGQKQQKNKDDNTKVRELQAYIYSAMDSKQFPILAYEFTTQFIQAIRLHAKPLMVLVEDFFKNSNLLFQFLKGRHLPQNTIFKLSKINSWLTLLQKYYLCAREWSVDYHKNIQNHGHSAIISEFSTTKSFCFAFVYLIYCKTTNQCN